jgi:excisionase family DNA binding protein
MSIDLKDRLYTSSEVAEILGVSLRSVYRYLEEGKLDADIKTATGRHRFSKKNILDFLRPSENRISEPKSTASYPLEDSSELDKLLDLPALNKTSSNIANSKDELDDFDFDFDEEFFKSLEKGNYNDATEIQPSDSYNKVKDGDYQDDDLEKLLREFEEQELLQATTPKKSTIEKESSSSDDDELSNLLKSLELDIQESATQNETQVKKDNIFDDFDFDFDLDMDFDKKEVLTQETSAYKTENKHSEPVETEDAEEDNWLERFRKAAEKNTVKREDKLEASTDNSNFGNIFDKHNLDVFFDKPQSGTVSSPVSSIASLSSGPEEPVEEEGKYEYHYTSTLGDLKEIAKTVDKVSKKFDIDYAFTLSAGLSLHKQIAPFSTIHLYVREKDLEIYEDYLKLTPSSEANSAVCLITQDTNEVFRDCYDLHGLNVVSNVQLRSDLIDKGLDKLAREI